MNICCYLGLKKTISGKWWCLVGFELGQKYSVYKSEFETPCTNE